MTKLSIIKEAAERAMDSETERTKTIFEKGEKFVAAIAAVAGFQLLDAKKLLKLHSILITGIFIAAFVFMAASFILAVCSLGVKEYVDYPRKDELLQPLKNSAITDTNAEQMITELLIESREINAKLNDEKAKYLKWCGWTLITGFGLAVACQLFTIFN